MLNSTPTSLDTLTALTIRQLSQGIQLAVHEGFDAFSSDLLVSMLCQSAAALGAPELASQLSQVSMEDEGFEFEGADYAQGLIRLSGAVRRTGQVQPAALALAHARVEAHRGVHEDLGCLLKLNISLEGCHIHRMGVGLGLDKEMALELTKQISALIAEFQRTASSKMTVMWTIDNTPSNSSSMFNMKSAVNEGLMRLMYGSTLD